MSCAYDAYTTEVDTLKALSANTSFTDIKSVLSEYSSHNEKVNVHGADSAHMSPSILQNHTTKAETTLVIHKTLNDCQTKM